MTCAGAPQACRKGMIDILGTELRTNCGCEGTAADFRELYDCIGWHRILWVNPCVGEFNLDLFFKFLLGYFVYEKTLQYGVNSKVCLIQDFFSLPKFVF